MDRATLKLIIVQAGGNSHLARLLGIRPQSISKWIALGTVPIDQVPKMARITGVPRHLLRPDRPDLFPPPNAKGDAA